MPEINNSKIHYGHIFVKELKLFPLQRCECCCKITHVKRLKCLLCGINIHSNCETDFTLICCKTLERDCLEKIYNKIPEITSLSHFGSIPCYQCGIRTSNPRLLIFEKNMT